MRIGVFALLGAVGLLLMREAIGNSSAVTRRADDCTRKGKTLYGKVEVVTSFPDLRVQVVESFPELRVQVVEAFPDQCGKWQFVSAFPDLQVQFVTSFPDLKVQFVNAFPGMTEHSP